jgi:RNA polymerase sigma factor (sigma-70 family)
MASQPYSHRRETAQRAPILERILRSERPRLLRHVRFHSERSQDAEDALADACVQFLRHYDGPAEMEDALRWMLLVAKHCAWEIARRRRRRECDHASVPSEVDEALIAEPDDGPAEQAERAEETEHALAAIGRLAPDERTALILFGLGCSYKEIASMRGWSVAKVNRRLNEGRARVRRMLREGGESS